ncbi:MAG: hypothetical protein AB7M05_14000 [Alphaproteobacteria bacterium]
MLKAAWIVGLTLMLGACAFGNTTDYQNQTPVFAATTGNPVAVAAYDQRPYVLSGKNSATYTGVTRAVVGVPYGVHTSSGRPLADDFSAAIANGLSAKGIQVTVVTVPYTETREQAIKTLLNQGKPRSLLVTIEDWESDQYIDASLTFTLKAEVFGTSAEPLASNTVTSRRGISGSILDIQPHNRASAQASLIAQQVLQQLLNDQKIVQALQ